MSELERKSEIDLLKHIQVVLFTENGRLLYQFKQQASSSSLTPVPVPATALATSNRGECTNRHINSNNCSNIDDGFQKSSLQQSNLSHDVIRKIQPSTNGANVQSQKSYLALSECIFGSVSIQSLPNTCVSKMHQLNVGSIMMSVVFEMQPQIISKHQQQQQQQHSAKLHKQHKMLSSINSTSSSTSSHLLKLKQHNNNHKSHPSSRWLDTKISTDKNNINSTTYQQQNVRKKLGLALIWDSVEDKLDQSGRNMRDFILDYSKAIDFHLNVLKDYISNTQALSSKLIHASVLNCLQSINEIANSSFVSNLKDFTEEDFVEEFVSLIEELELKTTNYTMSTIISILLSSEHLQELQVVLTSQNPDTKVLIMRILFVIRCLMFDKHLALLTPHINPITIIKKNTCSRRRNSDFQSYDSRSYDIKNNEDTEKLSEVQMAIPRPTTHVNLMSDSRILSKKITNNQFLSIRPLSKNNHSSVVKREKLSSSFDNTNLDTDINKISLYDAYTNGDEISTTMLAKSKLYMREYQSLRFSGPSSLPHASSITHTSNGGLSRSASGNVAEMSHGSTRESPIGIVSDLTIKPSPEASLIVKTKALNTPADTSAKNTLTNQIVDKTNNPKTVQSTSSQTYSNNDTNTNIPKDQLNTSITMRPIIEGSMVGFALIDPLELEPEPTVSRATSNQDKTQRLKDNSRCSFADSSVSASSGMFEFIKDPRVFQTKPLICLPPSYPSLNKIYEPVITSNYLISCALQCIITGQKELVNEKLTLATNNDKILHIDCDNWSTRMISCGALKTVVLSSVVMEIFNVMKQMKLFKVDTKLIIEYFYSKLTEESSNTFTKTLSLNDLSSSPSQYIVADISETCL